VEDVEVAKRVQVIGEVCWWGAKSIRISVFTKKVDILLLVLADLALKNKNLQRILYTKFQLSLALKLRVEFEMTDGLTVGRHFFLVAPPIPFHYYAYAHMIGKNLPQ